MTKINIVATNAEGNHEVLLLQSEAGQSGYTFLNDAVYGTIAVIRDGKLDNLRQFLVQEVSENYNSIYGLYGGDTPALASALHSYFQEAGTAGVYGLAELPVQNSSSIYPLGYSQDFRKSVLERVEWTVGAGMVRHDIGDFTVDTRGGTEQFPTYTPDGISVDTVSLGRRLNITRTDLHKRLGKHMVKIGEARGGRARFLRGGADYSEAHMKKIAEFRARYARVLNQTMVHQNSLAILADMVSKRITDVPYRKVWRTGSDSWTI